MSKTFRSISKSLALLSPLFVLATSAHALDTKKTYKVCFDGEVVGTWRLRNKVVDTGKACRYTVMWKNIQGGPLSRTALCTVEEAKAGDNFDCEVSRRGFFDTIVYRAKDCGVCRGFDDFGQQTKINELIAGEDASGFLAGIVMSHSVGDIQNLYID